MICISRFFRYNQSIFPIYSLGSHGMGLSQWEETLHRYRLLSLPETFLTCQWIENCCQGIQNGSISPILFHDIYIQSRNLHTGTSMANHKRLRWNNSQSIYAEGLLKTLPLCSVHLDRVLWSCLGTCVFFLATVKKLLTKRHWQWRESIRSLWRHCVPGVRRWNYYNRYGSYITKKTNPGKCVNKIRIMTECGSH